MCEMSGTVAKLTEGALKFGRALGVLTNPKVRRYAGIVKICINSTFFFPTELGRHEPSRKACSERHEEQIVCGTFVVFFVNGKLTFILRGLNATCCRHEFGDESL